MSGVLYFAPFHAKLNLIFSDRSILGWALKVERNRHFKIVSTTQSKKTWKDSQLSKEKAFVNTRPD